MGLRLAEVRCQQIIVHHAAEMVAAERFAVLRQEQRHVVRLDRELRPDLTALSSRNSEPLFPEILTRSDFAGKTSFKFR
ncbi:MAG: hypothetical protein DMG70_09315 [Acidobacteria bacterium]|nr:MAG: hypothetical protein DMG70_09315 [Acidobacteriota bacterium]